MAIARLAPPYLLFRGRDVNRTRAAGNVVSNSPNRCIVRQFNPPSSNFTLAQRTQQLYMTFAASQWAILSTSDQDAWIALGLTITRTDSLGGTYHPGGRTLYIENVLNSLRTNASVVASPPSSWTPNISFPPLSLTLATHTGTDGLEIAWVDSGLPGWFLVDFSPPLRPGVRSRKSVRFANPFVPTTGSFIQTDSVTTNPVFFELTQFVRAPLANELYWVRFTPVDAASNLTGVPQYARLTVS